MRVYISGYHMAYDDRGSGKPVLLLHGYPLNRKLWDPQIDSLADTARIIAPDLRGHGDSEPKPGIFSATQPYSMGLLAEDCAQLLAALQIEEPVVIVGLSMGGYIAFAFHRKYPQRVAALVLTATRAGADTPQGRASRDQAIARLQAEGVSAIAEGLLPKLLSPKTTATRPETVEIVRNIMLKTSPQGVVSDLLGMKGRPDMTPTLKDIRCPTLIIHGGDDQLIPVSEAQAMYQAIPNAQLEIISEAGHLPNLEQPERFNHTLRSFLQTLP